MNSVAKHIYNIEAGRPFARVLAEALLEEYRDQVEGLSDVLILLPTRRACRVLREAFLDVRGGQALILPRMQPVGDLDEEELSLSIFAGDDSEQGWSLPPALPPLQRQILLSQLVQKAYPERGAEQCLKLASALGHLMDQIYTENLSFDNLVSLVPEDFAAHWQVTLHFLEILSAAWPNILAERGVIDAADRRNRLILALAQHWEDHPPRMPVIGAGSTGSIPATAKLLSVIAGLEKGRVILPGLDQQLDEESWDALGETHPQFGFKHLLMQMNAAREDVQNFEVGLPESLNEKRRFLAREILRPAETAGRWAALGDAPQSRAALEESLQDLSLIECEHGREEADVIAVLMRQALEEPGKTACLITPDRTLAAKVAAACQRWGMTVDDSAGQSLHHSPRGVFARLVLQAALENAAPLAVLSILKHRLCVACDAQQFRALDMALRGLKPAGGFAGLRAHIDAQERLDSDVKDAALHTLDEMEPVFAPLLALRGSDAPFMEFLKTHLTACEKLAGEEAFWSGDEGRSASSFFAELFDHGEHIGALDLPDYAAALEHFMAQVQIRPAFGTHPRLQILGQLEARLIDADLVILGGLNENIWPPEPRIDPWMSRPMRTRFGLPSPERSIGLAAHDFMQGLCAPRVVLTRCLRSDGVPSVPARWLQRLDAVLKAAKIDAQALRGRDADVLHWARVLDKHETQCPATRPMPCPPVDKRPRRLSVTQIETWLRDPYAIYARHVLKLKPLDALEKPVEAAERGSIVHKILERFVRETKTSLPPEPAQILLRIARDEIEARHDDPHVWSFWWPRFGKAACWLAAHEADWRGAARNLALEARGEITLPAPGGDFKLVAVADRIDLYEASGAAALIDYKSGGQYSKSGMKNGAHPQLPLEALILREGGFAELGARPAHSLHYWVLSGSAGGTLTTLDDDIETLVEETRASLQHLIESYDDPSMPYICLPRSDKAPRFNDYEHLARIREWAAVSDDESEAA